MTSVRGHFRPSALQRNSALFDHLVGAAQQQGRDIDADRFCGFEVDHHLEFDRLLDWQIGRQGAMHDLDDPAPPR
jgi:hypothetical protein